MASRKIVKIDEEKCNGCGDCIINCPEGALAIVDGKARIVKDSYCDGLGACMGKCPLDAITIIEREAEPFDAEAVAARMKDAEPGQGSSQLSHWPVKLSLVVPNMVFLKEADLLLVADCVPFAMPDFHRQILHGRAVVIGCPKLNDVNDYVAKLASIFTNARPRKLTVVHMEVPCCFGLCRIVKEAMELAESSVPVEDITVSTTGTVIDEKVW